MNDNTELDMADFDPDLQQAMIDGDLTVDIAREYAAQDLEIDIELGNAIAGETPIEVINNARRLRKALTEVLTEKARVTATREVQRRLIPTTKVRGSGTRPVRTDFGDVIRESIKGRRR